MIRVPCFISPNSVLLLSLIKFSRFFPFYGLAPAIKFLTPAIIPVSGSAGDTVIMVRGKKALEAIHGKKLIKGK